MNKIVSALQLRFLPSSVDAGLLVLRLWFGSSMLALHGWAKLANFGAFAEKFGDPIGLGLSNEVNLSLAIFGEVVCAGLLALGLFTRFAAVGLAITMSVAFFLAHGGALTGERNGEMAFLYLGAYLSILIAGPGSYALDSMLGKGGKA